MKDHIDSNPVLAHRVEQVELSRLRITEKKLEKIRHNFERLLALNMRRCVKPVFNTMFFYTSHGHKQRFFE